LLRRSRPAAAAGFTDIGGGIKRKIQRGSGDGSGRDRAAKSITIKTHLWVVNRLRAARVKWA
jgi:hypothetical protein